MTTTWEEEFIVRSEKGCREKETKGAARQNQRKTQPQKTRVGEPVAGKAEERFLAAQPSAQKRRAGRN
jgi:hypothetical protein